MYIPLSSLTLTQQGNVAYQVRTEEYWDVSSQSGLINSLQQAFAKKQPYSLLKCLDSFLDKETRSLYASLQSGEMKPFKDEPESTLEALENGWFERC